MSKKTTLDRSTKRVLADIKNYISNKPELSHISFNTSNVKTIMVLFFGPSNTPYHHGNFFVELKFNSNYPFEPPKANFKSTDGTIRFNPNLYANGKVCLSILGTWSGPSWSIVQNLSSIILSIQSLLGEYPLHNEPGYEKCRPDEPKMVGYTQYVQYHTINYSILKMIKNKLYPPEFEHIIIKNFVDNFDSIIKIVENNIQLDEKTATTSYLCLKVIQNYKKLHEELLKLYEYGKQYIEKNEPKSLYKINDLEYSIQ
jgi:ubiquitin-conjugating enzyme E2 Z